MEKESKNKKDRQKYSQTQKKNKVHTKILREGEKTLTTKISLLRISSIFKRLLNKEKKIYIQNPFVPLLVLFSILSFLCFNKKKIKNKKEKIYKQM